MKYRDLISSAGAGIFSVFAVLGNVQAGMENPCPGYTRCPQVDFATVLARNPDAVRIERGVTSSEEAALAASRRPDLSPAQAKAVLGEILVFDRDLSVHHNQACFSCHTPEAGFTGGISLLDRTSVSFPGSVRIRTGNRKPQSAAYAAFAPVLHYEAAEGDFVGGNFFDSRATGLVTGQPAADQAMGPPTNPVEMALPDHACAIRRISVSRYADFFRRVWGADALAIRWPSDTDAICAQPNEGASDQQPVKLASQDRRRAEASYVNMAKSMAAFEATAAVSPFSSKFDAVLAGRARFTKEEEFGLQLFNGKAKCSECHLSDGDKPNFTDFTSVNLGIPKNSSNPFFFENADNGDGFVANPDGPSFVDDGLGGFLAGPDNPKPEWAALAADFVGAFQVATVRNVARKPRPGFVRAYMHNGFFTDLKTIVHFYNTRDVLPRCRRGGGLVGVTCWPEPAQPANLNTDEMGNLGLSDREEIAIVAFLETLSDGYFTPGSR